MLVTGKLIICFFNLFFECDCHAKHSLSKNLHKLNFSRQQIDILRTMMLTGYKMAELLSSNKIKNPELKDEIDSIVNEWNVVASELVVIMLRSQEFKAKD